MSERNRHIKDLFSLEGKTVLVTGGAGRYGRQISLALAESGARVLLASRNRARVESFKQELREAGYHADALTVDLTQTSSVAELVLEVGRRWPRVDALFNNAVTITAQTMTDCSAEDWALTMENNTTGLYEISRSFGNRMAEQGGGSIVNIGSIYGVVSPDFRVYQGHTEMTNPPAYGFIKAGMIQLTRYMAVYYAKFNVRVNCISPGGLYATTMPEQFVTSYSARTPLGRMAGVNDLKGATVFFASDASAYVTGQNLIVDGGLTAA